MKPAFTAPQLDALKKIDARDTGEPVVKVHPTVRRFLEARGLIQGGTYLRLTLAGMDALDALDAAKEPK